MSKSKIKAYGICLYLKEKNSIKILLCKSVKSTSKWGFLKGVALDNEKKEETALREFQEESGIYISSSQLESYFEQKNKTKDIGIYLVDGKKIKNLDKYFQNDKLKQRYNSNENSNVEFFDIDKLPNIKKKQTFIKNNILNYLKS